MRKEIKTIHFDKENVTISNYQIFWLQDAARMVSLLVTFSYISSGIKSKHLITIYLITYLLSPCTNKPIPILTVPHVSLKKVCNPFYYLLISHLSGKQKPHIFQIKFCIKLSIINRLEMLWKRSRDIE